MNPLLAVSLLALSSAAQDSDHPHDHGPQLGTITFETSCTAPANVPFRQALGWLHSFEYE